MDALLTLFQSLVVDHVQRLIQRQIIPVNQYLLSVGVLNDALIKRFSPAASLRDLE